MKVKTFVPNSGNTCHHDRLDIMINKFLEENDIDVIDIKYSTAFVNNNYWIQSAMLIYNEKITK